MTNAPFYRATCYAVKDAESGERLTSLGLSKQEAQNMRAQLDHTGRVLEVYRTSYSRPTARKGNPL